MVQLKECTVEGLCVDCQNEKCWHAGDKVADCPKYPQQCKIREQIDSCDECTWIDIYIDDMRKRRVCNGRQSSM